MLPNRKVSWVMLLLCAVTAFAVVAFPLYVIRPFRAQGAMELQIALFVRRWAPFVATLAAGFSVVLAAHLWRKSERTLLRTIGSLAALLTVGFGVLSHINVFELMFHRIEAPQLTAANAANLDPSDMVLVVNSGNQSRAYPIRMMGYHHIVNDNIDALAIVATY